QANGNSQPPAAPAKAASGPAFDCAKASSPTEHALCHDAALGALDSQLASLYASKLSQQSPDNVNAFKAEQRKWLTERNRCGGERSCLLNAYALRIAAMNPGSGQPPASTATNTAVAADADTPAMASTQP